MPVGSYPPSKHPNTVDYDHTDGSNNNPPREVFIRILDLIDSASHRFHAPVRKNRVNEERHQGNGGTECRIRGLYHALGGQGLSEVAVDNHQVDGTNNKKEDGYPDNKRPTETGDFFNLIKPAG